ncbi:hypothetical protein TSTA_084500 [Talaromyces stipitatus ATCC 10500]|uniref:Uncharacterized protein n=1 Tax=Talaromyces stipitatus (strain ATCC 10500 / CBS 375.48 / QM 6759 / NRRL 1006) TaxID=441959 RepID=B8M0C2_TALSN|nr:uncharacterized protein TSTA_084500 [Talaromyces stipitatus ATCC 10500]EED21219.1 hypothetical protein TSTA_084500 [Talaromyces stipitatus ATCC 10500]
MDVLSALKVIHNASDEELKEALASESIHDFIFETLGRVQNLVVTTSPSTVTSPSRTSSLHTSSPPAPSPPISSPPHPTPENSKAISLFEHVERSIPWLLDFTKQSPASIIKKKGTRTWDPRLDDILRCGRKATRQEILFRGYAQRSFALQFIQEQELQGKPSRVEELCLAVLKLATDTDQSQSQSILNQKSHSIACFVKDYICIDSHHDEYGSALEGVYAGLRILVAERLLEKKLSQSLITAGLAAVLAVVARFSFASFETIRDLISCIVANPEISPLRKKKSSTTEEPPRRILEILLELSPWSSDFQSCYTSLKTRGWAGSSNTELSERIQSSDDYCSNTSGSAHHQWSDTSSIATDLAEDDDFSQPLPKRPCLDHSAARPYRSEISVSQYDSFLGTPQALNLSANIAHRLGENGGDRSQLLNNDPQSIHVPTSLHMAGMEPRYTQLTPGVSDIPLDLINYSQSTPQAPNVSMGSAETQSMPGVSGIPLDLAQQTLNRYLMLQVTRLARHTILNRCLVFQTFHWTW